MRGRSRNTGNWLNRVQNMASDPSWVPVEVGRQRVAGCSFYQVFFSNLVSKNLLKTVGDTVYFNFILCDPIPPNKSTTSDTTTTSTTTTTPLTLSASTTTIAAATAYAANNNNNNNKITLWPFKRLINNISRQKTWTWLRKGNLKRETESLLIAAQENVIRTNHIKARIDKTQQNSKCRLWSDGDETINHIKSECSKLAQKEYKARYDWVGKVVHREMCRKFQFDHTSKWYMHNPAPVLENDSH